jgi:hypothetical protein
MEATIFLMISSSQFTIRSLTLSHLAERRITNIYMQQRVMDDIRQYAADLPRCDRNRVPFRWFIE